MTSRELYLEYQSCLKSKGMRRIDGINTNSTKRELQSAIDCLKASDEEMLLKLEKFSGKFPGTANVIKNNGNFLTHPFNRYYVYISA